MYILAGKTNNMIRVFERICGRCPSDGTPGGTLLTTRFITTKRWLERKRFYLQLLSRRTTNAPGRISKVQSPLRNLDIRLPINGHRQFEIVEESGTEVEQGIESCAKLPL